MAVEIAQAYVSLIPSFKGGAAAISQQMGGPAQAAGAQAGSRFGSGFAGAVKKFSLVAGAGFAAAGVGLFKVGEIFDDVTDTIRVGTGATGDALNGLVQSARNVGREVPASFGQIGTVIADLNTRLGLTGPTLETLAKQFLEAGRILGEEVNVQAATGAFSAFRIEGEDTTAAMDTLFQVSQATGVGINDLAARLSKQGTIVAQLGFSFEDAAALLGILNKAGIDGNAVFASMQAGLVRLSKDGEAPADAFDRVTTEIQAFLDAGNDAAAIDLAGQAFGTRGAGQMISALKSGKLNFEDMASAAGLSGDSILEVGEDTADLAEKWQLFKNRALLAIEPIAIRVFDALGSGMEWINTTGVPALSRFTDVAADRLGPAFSAIGSVVTETVLPALRSAGSWLTETGIPALRDFVGWLQKNQSWLLPIAVGIGAMTAAFVAYRAAVVVASTVSKAWAAVQALLNLVLAANPIGIVILALVGLAAGLTYAWKHSETFRNIVTGVWNAVRDGVTAAWNWIYSNVIVKFVEAGVWLWNRFIAVKDGVVAAFNAVRDGLGAAWGWIRDNAINPLLNGFQSAWDKAVAVKDGIVSAFTTVKDSIAEIFSGVVDAVKAPIRALLGFINRNIISKLNWVTEKFGFTIPTINIGFNRGGVVPGGGPNRDTVMAAMTPGEGVLTRRTTQALGGRPAIDALNAGGVNLDRVRQTIGASFNTGPDKRDISAQYARDMLAAIGRGAFIEEDYSWKGMSKLYQDSLRFQAMKGLQWQQGMKIAQRNGLLVEYLQHYLHDRPNDAYLRSGKPLLDWGLAQGGPSIGDIWDALTDAGEAGVLPSWTQGAYEGGQIAVGGVKKMLGAALDLAINAASGLGGPAVPMDLFRSWLTKAKESILSWGEKQDNQLSGFSKEVGGTLQKGGWLTPLRSGTYRVGRGTAGHGYPAQDLPSPTGTSILAAQAGRVSAVRHMNTSYGNHIRVNHPGGYQTLYAHLSSTLGTQIGESIRRGGLLGRVGSTGNSTGPHLHLEILSGGRRLDPARYFKFDSGMGVLPTGHSLVYNGTGGPEPLVDPRRFDTSGGSPRVQITTLGTPQDVVNEVVWRIRMDDLSTQLPLGG